MAKILVVEDNENVSRGIRDWLARERYCVEIASTGKDGLQLLQHYQYDLVILDWELPGMCGLDVCSEFRGHGGVTPILMLTCRKSLREKRTGLDSGCDDYLTKPFEPEELSARVRALLRRPATVNSGPLRAGSIIVDPVSRTVTRNGEQLHCSPKEYALLEFLIKHPNRVFSQNELFRQAWESASDASSPEMVRTFIRKLRSKLDLEGEESLIHNVHGQGYKLVL